MIVECSFALLVKKFSLGKHFAHVVQEERSGHFGLSGRLARHEDLSLFIVKDHRQGAGDKQGLLPKMEDGERGQNLRPGEDEWKTPLTL